jgi:hypothetical protein
MSNAQLGYGILVEMSLPATPTVWVEIEEVFSVTPPSDVDEQVDVTHYQSPDRRREFIAGLTDGGECAMEMNFIPGSTTDVFLIAAQGLPRNIRITYFNGVTVSFVGQRQGYEIAPPVDDKMTATATFKVTGEVTQAAAAAPVNSVLPSIAGTPQVGQTLTAHEGVWTGAPQFTYQWKNEGVNISLATNKTYVPVAGDIGDNLTVAVTGTNATGAATATSAEAIPVIA